MVCLDLDELPALFDRRLAVVRARPGAAPGFAARLPRRPRTPLADAVRALVRERTGARPDGPIRLLTHLRYFGHCFNPVSFYYCYDADGERVSAVVAEVTNTPWGERHSYVLDVDAGGRPREREARWRGHAKELHVSPLMGMDHTYDWRLTEPGERLSVHIDSRRPCRRERSSTPRWPCGAARSAARELARALLVAIRC